MGSCSTHSLKQHFQHFYLGARTTPSEEMGDWIVRGSFPRACVVGSSALALHHYEIEAFECFKQGFQ